MTEPSVTFRPIELEDIERLRAWLDAPHVRRWWRDDRTDDVISAAMAGGAAGLAAASSAFGWGHGPQTAGYFIMMTSIGLFLAPSFMVAISAPSQRY